MVCENHSRDLLVVTSGLSNNKVVIFATENSDTSEVITDDEFLQMEQNQSWHSGALLVREF